jgi:hypothetical protein
VSRGPLRPTSLVAHESFPAALRFIGQSGPHVRDIPSRRTEASHLDDPTNRPASTSRDQEASTVPNDVPAPHPVAGGGTGVDTTGRAQDEGPQNDTKQAAKQEGQQVAADARGHAQEVADTERQGVAEVTDEARHHAIDLAEDARRQLHDQARQQTDHLGHAIQDLGHKLHALAEGRTDETGQVGDYTDRVADQVDRIGGRVQELGFDGTVDELQRFARRRPGVFLLGAAVAGFAVSRLGRGAKDAQQPGGGDDRDQMQGGPRDRSLMSSGPRNLPARSGQPPIEGQGPAGTPTAPTPSRPPSPTVGDVPSNVPPPPPAVPAPDPTAPRGRP